MEYKLRQARVAEANTSGYTGNKEVIEYYLKATRFGSRPYLSHIKPTVNPLFYTMLWVNVEVMWV